MSDTRTPATSTSATLDPWGSVDAAISSGTVAIAPGENAITTPSNDLVNVLADGSHTRGLASFLEYRLAARSPGPPTHWHPAYDELFYIVSGRMGMRTPDSEGEYGPRSFVFVPRGMPHTFWNPTDDECVFVSAWTPAGAEQAWLMAHHLMNEFGVVDGDYSGVPGDRIAELLVVSGTVQFEP